MGGSCWEYFIPYQPDIARALQELRQAAFEAGEYYDVGAFLRFEYEHNGFKMLPERRKWIRAELTRLGVQGSPRTIAELLRRNGNAGAHSILDITRLASTLETGAAAPLPAKQLRELFGTQRPTHAMVVARLEQLYEVCKRDEAIYLVVYDQKLATELCFVGCSGD